MMESTLAHLLVCTAVAMCVGLIFHKKSKASLALRPWLAVALVGAILSFWLAASSGILTRLDFSTNWWLAGPLIVLGSVFSCELRWLVIQRRRRH
ncbi:MAG: hypothetical protein IPO65_03125 [Saprospiraceae bacterium]|nr:hypothetical protein [Saprospiraceae bacterium]